MNSILKIAPREARSLNLLGVIRASQGRLDEAESFFTRAILFDRLLVGAHMNLAYLYMLKGAKQGGPVEWGRMTARSQYALIMLATEFTWMMALMGYIRCSVRLFWHVNEIMRDNSPWAYTHTVGFAANMISFNVLFFWGSILFVFWLATLGKKKAPVTESLPTPALLPQAVPNLK